MRTPRGDGEAGARVVTLLGALALAWATACGRIPGSPFEPPTGVVEGRVRLAEGMGLPGYAPFDMARAALRKANAPATPEACRPALEEARRPVQLGPERGLSNVVVAASDFVRLPKHEKASHRVALRGCRLEPAVVSAMEGDSLAIENRAERSVELMYGGSPSPLALAEGGSRRIALVAGIDSLLCTPAAPCGRTDVVVFHHPVHAVSDARGAFRIAPFPAGELVRVTAWHPLFEPGETFVWLEPGQRIVIDLVLFPKLRFLPPAAPP